MGKCEKTCSEEICPLFWFEFVAMSAAEMGGRIFGWFLLGNGGISVVPPSEWALPLALRLVVTSINAFKSI